MKKAAAYAFATLLAAASAPLVRAALQFPPIEVGSTIRIEFSLSAIGGPALGGIPIHLTVGEECGSFSGRSSLDVTTDSAGKAAFDFTAGARTLACRIRGESDGITADGFITVYRPSDVVIDFDQPVQNVQVSSLALFTGRVNAAGIGMLGAPIAIDPLPATGASATYASSPQSTVGGNSGDQVAFLLKTNAVPGIYDFAVHVAGKSRTLRVSQSAAGPSQDPAGRSMRLFRAPDDLAAARLSIVEGPASCMLSEATYVPDISSFALPPGAASFPLGYVQFAVFNCAAGTVKLKLEYPKPVPFGVSFVLKVPARDPNPTGWVPYPALLDASSAMFTVTDEGAGDQLGNPGVVQGIVALAQLGAAPVVRELLQVQSMWWAGPLENGWGLSLAQTTDRTNMFGAIYAYDGAGKPTWWVMNGGNWDRTKGTFSGPMYFPRGTPWFSYDPKLFTAGDSAGMLELAFTDADRGAFNASVNGVVMRKALERQVFGVASSTQVPTVGGMWYGGPQQSGWGISIMQQQATLFSVWFTYDETNFPTWVVMPGGAWTGPSTYEGRIYKTRGSPWLGRSYDPAQFHVTDVGGYRLSFNGATATFDYSMDGRSGTLSLVRQAPF